MEKEGDFITGLEKKILEDEKVWADLVQWGCKSVHEVNIDWGVTPMRIIEGSRITVSFDRYTGEIFEYRKKL